MQENNYSDAVKCFCFRSKSNVNDKSVSKIAADLVHCNLELFDISGSELEKVGHKKHKGVRFPQYISPPEEKFLLRNFTNCEVLKETDQPSVFQFNTATLLGDDTNYIPALICITQPSEAASLDRLTDSQSDSNILYSTNGDTFCSYPVLILCSKRADSAFEKKEDIDVDEIKLETCEEPKCEVEVQEQSTSKDLKSRLQDISLPDKKKVRFNQMDMDANFRVTLSIKNEANGQTVFYKADKNRFRRDKTIKLMSNSFYRVDISFKPTQTLSRAVIAGQEVKATERVHDSTASAYSLHLSTCNMPPTHKGHRDELPLIAQLSNGLLLHLTLQVKIYKEGDNHHCDWGSTFHCVEYECECYSDASVVSIMKETFR